MTRTLLVVILTIILAGTWAGISGAGEPYSLEKAYNMEKAERGFAIPSRAEPSAAVVMFDAALGRPLGLATTTLGTGVFVLTLPFSAPSRSVNDAAWGLVGRPGGWTFVRPLGKGDSRYEEKSLFR